MWGLMSKVHMELIQLSMKHTHTHRASRTLKSALSQGLICWSVGLCEVVYYYFVRECPTIHWCMFIHSLSFSVRSVTLQSHIDVLVFSPVLAFFYLCCRGTVCGSSGSICLVAAFVENHLLFFVSHATDIFLFFFLLFLVICYLINLYSH